MDWGAIIAIILIILLFAINEMPVKQHKKTELDRAMSWLMWLRLAMLPFDAKRAYILAVVSLHTGKKQWRLRPLPDKSKWILRKKDI